MDYKLLQEIQLRLKAPAIALWRILKGKHVPNIFVKAALDDLKKAHKLTEELEKKWKE